MSADIEKAYLSIGLRKEDQDSVRIAWFRNALGPSPVQEFWRFTRVVFGVTASPLLLTAKLQSHARKFEEIHPKAAKAIARDTYVDDLASDGNTEKEAATLVGDVVAMECGEKAGLRFRRVRSNSPAVIEGAQSLVGEEAPNSNSTKLLGLVWNLTTDDISVGASFLKTVAESPRHRTSLRVALSLSSKLHDLLGIASPVRIDSRLLVQDAFKMKVTWDEDLPTELKTRFLTWPSLTELTVTRWMLTEENEGNLELHVFWRCQRQGVWRGRVSSTRMRKWRAGGARFKLSKGFASLTSEKRAASSCGSSEIGVIY